MTTPPTIRLATVADIDVLRDLNAEVHRLHLERRPDQFKPTEPTQLDSWFRQRLLDPVTRVWVAELESRVVGYVVVIAYSRDEGPFCPGRAWWELDQIAVLAAFRQQGIGNALVTKVIVEAREAHILQVELNSWAFNLTAHDVFSSLGFVPKMIRFELREPAPDLEP